MIPRQETETALPLERRSTQPELKWIVAGAAIIVSSMLAALVATQMVKERITRTETARLLTGGDPERAPAVMRTYGCAGCHTIPGVSGADGKVGGSLSGLRRRVYVAGVLNNTPDNLARWIALPPTFSAGTAMPETGISKTEARDVAAYLYAH
jgi:cytochrome c2